MSRINRRGFAAGSAAFAFAPYIARADKKFDTGATDKEIKLGHTNPYSGPLSAYGTIGKAITAYWQMVNETGGVNGRKVNFITYDDGFVPSKTVEMVRKLVEDDQVFAIFQLLGTPTNTVVQKYLNQKKVPQLFVATGASKWGDPEHFPWTMGWQPDYATEGDLRQAHAGQAQGRPQERARRHALSERRFGEGLHRRLPDRPGQGKPAPGLGQGELRGHRSDGRQPDHPAQELGRQ